VFVYLGSVQFFFFCVSIVDYRWVTKNSSFMSDLPWWSVILKAINRFYAVGCSELFLMWTSLNVILLVRFPMWTLFVLVKRMWLEDTVSAYPAGRLCGRSMIGAEVWLLLWRVNSAKQYTYIKALYAWSILTEQVYSCCWPFWLAFGGYPVWPLTMLRFSWFYSGPSGEFWDLEIGHDPFIPCSHSSFISPNMRRFVAWATYIVFK
jgi:hypothetical protein